MKRTLSALGILTMFFSAVALAQAPAAGTKTDPLLGTWKLNLEKTTPKPPAGVVSVRQYTLRPDGFIVTIFSGVSAHTPPALRQLR